MQVTFSGQVDPATGMVCNLADLDAFAQTNLLARFDHNNLNTLECFAEKVSTTENLSIEIYRIFQSFPAAHLEQVHIEETSNNSFDFAGNRLSGAGTSKKGHPCPSHSATIESLSLDNISTQDLYREILIRIGEDPNRDGLLKTPERMEKSMQFLTRGYTMNVTEVLHEALFDVDYDEMVIVKDIEFFSMCEHHLLPFFGKAHIAYVPNGKVIGLSKIPRLVDVFARRLQVQERLTRQVGEAITDAINPQGVAVILEAQHLCMMMRGVEKQHSSTVTSAMLGVFKSQLQTRNEFLSLVRRKGNSF